MDYKINRLLFVIKFHYFFFFAAIGCVMPFLPVYLQTLGLSQSAIGFIYLLLPISVIICKPLFGNLADRFHCHKLIFVASLGFMTVAYFCISLIPEIRVLPEPVHLNNTLECKYKSDSDKTLQLLICDRSASDCFKNFMSLKCEVICPTNCSSSSESECNINSNGSKSQNTQFQTDLLQTLNLQEDCALFGDSKRHLSNEMCGWNLTECRVQCECKSAGETDDTSYALLILCMLGSYMAAGVAISLGDTLAINISDAEGSNFGIQRVWGSIGWGLTAVIAGNVLDIVGLEKSTGHSVNPVFYIFVALSVIDIIACTRVRIIELPKPKKMLRRLGGVFSRPIVMVFVSAVFVMGFMTAALWTFLFVYVKQLGGTPLLFGLIMGVQCFLGEIPFFLLADPILKKIGHLQAMAVALVGFAIRFIGYSVVTNPWHILPLELTNGVSFGLFFSGMVSFANSVAPEGMAATMQGILQSIFEGVGLGIGSLVTGCLFDYIDGRYTYLCLGIATGVFFIVYELAVCVLKRSGTQSSLQPESSQTIDVIPSPSEE